MKKIISLFQRNYETDRKVRDEIVPGAEWVAAGEGVATVKVDGTSCMIRDGKLYKRYDRKEGKPAPEGWEACEETANENTGHWPGWVPVGDGPDDKRHREGLANLTSVITGIGDGDVWNKTNDTPNPPDGTYELVGPKVQSNPYGLEKHELWRHGASRFFSASGSGLFAVTDPPRTFNELRAWLEANPQYEGIVWHHADGRMVKIKRKDFGFPWPGRQK